jgi:hypothetical protein
VDLKTAEGLARQRVTALWPELAEVQPTIAARRRAAVVPRASTRDAVTSGREQDEITFTFAGTLRTPEGDLKPRIARVTVRAGSGVVRATLSR